MCAFVARPADISPHPHIMRYHNVTVLLLLLCLTAAQVYSVHLMTELSKTSIADAGLEKNLPACFNSDSLYQIRKGKLCITDMSRVRRDVRSASKNSGSGSSSEGEHHTIKFKASDLYPKAGRAAIDSLYVTNTSLAAVGISAAAAACVIDENNELMNCISGYRGSDFGASVCIDESNELLIVSAPRSNSFWVSQRHANVWAPPQQIFVWGATAADALGTGLACVHNVCALGAPDAQNGAGEIWLMKHTGSGLEWTELCSLPPITGMQKLGEILRAAIYDAHDDVMLLQVSGQPEGSDLLLPILYRLKLDGSNCDTVLPEIDFAISDDYVCSVEDRGSLCIDKLHLSHPHSSSSSE